MYPIITGLNQNIIENYVNNRKIVFLGDSILKNDKYVDRNENVAELVRGKGQLDVINLAVDGSSIADIKDQINNIPDAFNNQNTFVFLSNGGNDILNNYIYNDTYSTKTMDKMFQSYKYMIDTLRSKMDKARLVLLNIYNPKEDKLREYDLIINDWNMRLNNYYLANDKNITILDVNSIFNDKRDFTLDEVDGYYIEPSSMGASKLAYEIIEFVREN